MLNKPDDLNISSQDFDDTFLSNKAPDLNELLSEFDLDCIINSPNSLGEKTKFPFKTNYIVESLPNLTSEETTSSYIANLGIDTEFYTCKISNENKILSYQWCLILNNKILKGIFYQKAWIKRIG